MDLDYLVRVTIGIGAAQCLSQIKVDTFIAESRRAQKTSQALPMFRGYPGFFLQFPLCGVFRGFGMFYLAGRKFP